MPRDPRPYTTYPLNYSTHPRFEGLSDAAFRAFHEMQDHSRVHGLDGVLPVPTALKRWKQKVLDELVAGAPGTDRPLVELSAAGYFIRGYVEHQFTTADAAALRAKRALAGAAGGRAKASNAVASASGYVERSASKRVARSESEVDGQTDDGDTRPLVTEVDAGEADETGFFAQAAASVGIRNIARVRVAVERVIGVLPSDGHLIDVVRAIVLLANEPVRSVEAYVEKTCLNSPGEVADQWAAVKAVGP